LISENGLFTHQCKFDMPVNDWLWELPYWFNLHSYQSLEAWIVALMEREVWKKFSIAKQQSKRKNLDWKMGQDSLLWKENEILEFWKSLDKPNRRKVFLTILYNIFLYKLNNSNCIFRF